MDATRYDWSRPLFDHVHLRVRDLSASRAFYATVLEPLGVPLLLDTPDLLGCPRERSPRGKVWGPTPGPRMRGSAAW
jgi:catechol 2,3-dioxygenase-like lactoylglutathione lyase family enzyme